jgi:flagellar basal-body rod modification protein FlgD
MTAIDPFASLRVQTAQQKTEAKASENQFGKDTFLKLLVAQLRYQNPLQPTDSSEFMAQTAQFTMVEKLEEIEKQNKNAASANQVLAAASMIGKSVTWKPTEATTPQATTKVTLGGNLPANATTGTTLQTTTDVYTNGGTKIPLRMTMSKLEAESGSTWELHIYSGNVELGPARTVTFDANGEITSGNVTITTPQLEQITGTTGGWPTGGIVLSGQGSDTGRLRSSNSAGTFGVREQNGSDGTSFTGIVTALKIDPEHGALLHIGDNDVSLSVITDIQVPKV